MTGWIRRSVSRRLTHRAACGHCDSLWWLHVVQSPLATVSTGPSSNMWFGKNALAAYGYVMTVQHGVIYHAAV